ncbi:PfkB family carbohydrate kinase [Vibrio artabrorum]|uniref:PfkB family carbohydrate kinase n=1 Tax=Vibrio artabrorum TaxID=446374 RepID=UPI00354CB3E6
MNKLDRIEIIRKRIVKNKTVFVRLLSDDLNVSQRTIRRDIKALCNDGVAIAFFGGAKLIDKNTSSNFKSTGINEIMEKLKYKNTSPLLKGADKNTPIDVYVLGSFNVDIVSTINKFPKVGQTVKSLSTEFHPGGKGSNQATAASKVSENVHLTIKVGCDEFAEKARSYLSCTSISSFSIFENADKPTGNAIIMISEHDKDNIISIDLGANETFVFQDLLSEFDNISQSRVFLTQLENNFDITKLAIEYAWACDDISTVMLNPAPYHPGVIELAPYVDIITPNETEATDLSGILVNDIDSAKKAAKIIHSMGFGIVIITLGSNGCVYFDGDDFIHYKAYKAMVVDTVGAGDSFNGSLAASIAKNATVDNAIKYAMAFASLAVEREGASNMPEHDMVLNRLNLVL